MQTVVPTFLSIGGGVGGILPGILPADVVALAPHQQDELVPVPGVPHTLVDEIHQPEFPALAFGGSMVFSGGDGCYLFLLLGLEYRQMEFHTDFVVALPEFRRLRFADVELLAILQADAVDDEVGVDVVTVRVGTDQDFTPLEVFCQLQCGGVGRGGVYRLSLWKGLDHVVEHPALLLMVEKFRLEEIIIDTLRTAVDTADQLLIPPSCFLFLPDVPHDSTHTAAALAAGIVCKTDDGYPDRLALS